MIRECCTSALVLSSATVLCAQSHLARPVIDTVDHRIVRVMNPGPTAWTDTNGWKLVYERTVQPVEGAPGMLQTPSGLLLLPDGRLIVTDDKSTTINLYGADGTWIRSLGRKGEGPGEYHAIEPALLGDTVFVHDYLLVRGTLLTLAGKVIRTFPTACCFGYYGAVADVRGYLHVMGPSINRHGQWIAFSSAGNRVDSITAPALEPPHQWIVHTANGSSTFNVPLSPINWNIMLRDASVLFGATDALHFLVTAHGNDTVRVFDGPAVPRVAVDGRIRDSLYHLYTDHNAALRAIASEGDIPRSYPVWRDMTEDAAGNIWVLVGARTDALQRFAVFTPDGRFLGWVASPPIRYLSQTAWTSDHMALIDTDDHDLPRIRFFRIDRRGH